MTTIGNEMTHNRFQGEVKGIKILVVDCIPEHPKLKELAVLAGPLKTGQEKRRERRKNKRRSY